MPKYREANVVKIKQDVAKESKKLTDTISKRVEEEKELERLQALTRAESKKVGEIWERAQTDLLIAGTAKKALETDCEGLRADKGVLESQVALWRSLLGETIERLSKITVQKRPLFFDSLIKESRKILANIVSQTTAEEIRLDALKSEAGSLEEKTEALKAQDAAFTGKVAVLNQEIVRKRRELIALEQSKSDLERRETNVEAMEVRLTPEFKKLYRGYQEKKEEKKNGV